MEKPSEEIMNLVNCTWLKIIQVYFDNTYITQHISCSFQLPQQWVLCGRKHIIICISFVLLIVCSVFCL